MYVMQSAPFMSLVTASLLRITERKLCHGFLKPPEALMLQIAKGNV